MKLDRRTVLSGTAAAFAAPLFSALPARADAKRQSLVDSCLESARKVLSGKDFPDAAKQMTTAKGVLIIPELVQGGFFLGAAGGRGALMARNGARNWSPPAFYGMGSGSLGLQIGAKVSDSSSQANAPASTGSSMEATDEPVADRCPSDDSVSR